MKGRSKNGSSSYRTRSLFNLPCFVYLLNKQKLSLLSGRLFFWLMHEKSERFELSRRFHKQGCTYIPWKHGTCLGEGNWTPVRFSRFDCFGICDSCHLLHFSFLASPLERRHTFQNTPQQPLMHIRVFLILIKIERQKCRFKCLTNDVILVIMYV